MIRIYFLLFTCFAWLSCSSSQEKSNTKEGSGFGDTNSNGIKDSTTSISSLNNSVNAQWKKDTLSSQEKGILNYFASENEFIIISNQVERLFITGNEQPIMSRLSFSEKQLTEKGYISYELKTYGKFTDVSIYYSYNMGQASNGFGSIIGTDTSNYVHSFQSCGVTRCITRVFQNGKMILDK
ncbi:hypothetical protein A3860_36385 [Niastella vici]|uniref:Lipoprotein n=1 Tax=Niastella vici TaxID=1703345 RepID=A0A1V9FN44_9BACT|nr:hypothetical protein [Niastella vici]OQP59760.1 hypothetical protein A3860_36385 [Niastella vici]